DRVEATYTVKNTGAATATVKLLTIDGVAVDAHGAQVYLRGYKDGAGNPFFDQDVRMGATTTPRSETFELAPGASATVKMIFGKQGPGAPVPYSATYDLKFDFVTKK
ncbi:MAG: hypothetical protein WBA87_05565, partial [Microbacterium sp.]